MAIAMYRDVVAMHSEAVDNHSPREPGVSPMSACSDGCEAKAWGCYLLCIAAPFGVFWCWTPCQNGYWQCAAACGG
jgi:hypothetical protein